MAAFNWVSISIDMGEGDTKYSLADMAGIPAAAAPTMSFTHEYVHYLQSLGSVAGCRWLAELIDLAAATAPRGERQRRPRCSWPNVVGRLDRRPSNRAEKS